jgi:hypothetical protein
MTQQCCLLQALPQGVIACLLGCWHLTFSGCCASVGFGAACSLAAAATEVCGVPVRHIGAVCSVMRQRWGQPASGSMPARHAGHARRRAVLPKEAVRTAAAAAAWSPAAATYRYHAF